MAHVKDLLAAIPVLTFKRDGDLPVSMGTQEIMLDGKEFPFTTVGPWKIEIGHDRITTLRVEIAVKLGEVPS
jgi:hypothetical protein